MTQFALGVDIGGTNTKVALVNDSGDVAGIERFPTGLDHAALIANIREAANRCRGDSLILGAGVAVAGFINAAHDRLSYNPNLEWLVDFPLRDAIADALGVETTLEVDSNASCLGEYRFGSGRGSERFLCLVSGTGLGVGMVIDGALVRFMGECIGDAGHVVVDPNGPECPCGGRGCAEAMVSERTIVQNAQSGATLRDVMENARQGNARCDSRTSSRGTSARRSNGVPISDLFPGSHRPCRWFSRS